MFCVYYSTASHTMVFQVFRHQHILDGRQVKKSCTLYIHMLHFKVVVEKLLITNFNLKFSRDFMSQKYPN